MDQAYFEKTFKNEKLREIVRKAILGGKYKPGEMLPSQNEMCQMYGVSNHTVREAIGSLVHEGLLYRVQGKGTFVAERSMDNLTIGMVTNRLHRDLGTHYRLGYDIIPILVQNVEEEARAYGASVILSLDHDDADAERRILMGMVERKVDGIVLYYIGRKHNLDCLRKIRDAGIPLVLIDRYVEEVDTDYVVTDNFGGAYHAVRHLIDNGFTKIYHLTIDSEASSIRERHRGYRRALDDAGIGYDPALVMPVCADAFPNTALGVDFHEAGRIASEIASAQQGKFGLFAATSSIVAGFWRAVRFSGDVRGRVGMACFDVPIQGIPGEIPFIKVVQPLEQIGKRAVQLIVRRLRGDTEVQHVVLGPEYRVETPRGPVRAANTVSSEDATV